ncbi:MAG: hypothetical protein E6Q83_00240 [Thiothrix sp.]|nr:MAG: hypothetical protein E6Q83_00240 [Thiothrix sp.]
MTSQATNFNQGFNKLQQALQEIGLLRQDYARDLLEQSLALEAGKKQGGLPSAYFNKMELMAVKSAVITEKMGSLMTLMAAYEQSNTPHAKPVLNHSVQALGGKLEGIDLLYC